MWRKNVGKKPNRIVSIIFVATLVALLMLTPLMSLVMAGDANASVGSTTVATEEDLKTIVTEETSIPPQIQVVNPALKDGLKPTPIEFDVELVQDFELGDVDLSTYANKPLGDERSAPMGSIDPEPMDAPFFASDILVYNDAVNSEKNVSLAKTTNGDLYVSYDHDIGTGLRDVYVSKSTDGGLTWAKRDIAVDAAEDESCPSIAGDYSPIFAGDVLYVWYNNPTLEFVWSQDGDTWNLYDFGGGITWWEYANCPYVDVLDDATVVVTEYYDTTNSIDTLRIIYTVDGSSWTSYNFNMWPDAWVYQPRVSIQSVDAGAGEADIVVTLTIQDRSDPNPANWLYNAYLTDATLKGGGDDWGPFYCFSVDEFLDFTSPDVAANDREVIFVMSIYNPAVLGRNTMSTFCIWTDDLEDIDTTVWNGCGGTTYLAFDPSDVKDQKYTKLYREGTGVHAVWLNGTDISYMFSPNGGANWIGPPMKVNDPSSSTALDAWHSPDVILRDGKAGVAWHDSRGSDNIYFQIFENSRWYEIRADPHEPNLEVREVGDSWHPSIYYYLWTDGTLHSIEATSQWNDGGTRHTFNQWSHNGSTNNPETYTVSGTSFNNTAIYTTEFMLSINGGMGTTTPVTGWRPAYTYVTIEAVPPPPPGPGSRFNFLGWSGAVNNGTNPCIDCIYMDGPKAVFANWSLQHNVTIYTDPVPLMIEVNGMGYMAPFSSWFDDSNLYTLNAVSPQYVGPTKRYTWTLWSDFGAQSHNVAVTAPTDFTAFFRAEFNVTIDTNPTGLQVRIDGLEYTAPYSFWCLEFSWPWIMALSPQYTGVLGERYVWRDWSTGDNQSFQHNCTGAETIIANYTLQRSVNITTVPDFVTVIVDGNLTATPAWFWWNDTSTHTLEAPEYISVGLNQRLPFSYWSNLQSRVHTYRADTSDDTVTAFYGPLQLSVMLRANHTGLTIDLNGSPIALPYDFWCYESSNHLLSAPSIQQFGDTRYVFDSWSDGGAQTHFFACDVPEVIQVNYIKEYRVYINSTLDSNPATLNVNAGGITYSTPVELWWQADMLMGLDADEFQPESDPVSGVRYGFVDWDDSAIRTRTVVVHTPSLEYVANFRTQFKLTFVDPHGTPATIPAGWAVADGFYFDSGTVVEIQTNNTVADTTDHRWRFDGWSSADPDGYTGPNNPATITMNNPTTQTASWVDQYLLTIDTAYGTPVATNWFEQHATIPNAYWYDVGDLAYFWIESEVMISADEKAVFDMWVGGSNGTVMNAGLAITALWDSYYMVTVISPYGTPPASSWVIEGGSFLLDIEEYVTFGDSRRYFIGWNTSDTANGGYEGPNRWVWLTVTGPFIETAIWETRHLLTVISDYGPPTVIGWKNPENATAYWYVEGDPAIFWVEAEVYISAENDAKAVFEQWSGATNGTAMTSAATVTASWHLEYLVTVESEFGTVPPDAWIRHGQTHQISINKTVQHPTNEYTRIAFTSWSTDDTDSGGYVGANNEPVLTVTGPIAQTANWVTQHYIRIVSTYEEEPDTLGDPKGMGWHDENSVATIEVAGSETKGGWVYKFENWVGEVDDHVNNKTTMTVDMPRLLLAMWSKSEETQPLSVLVWIAIVIVVIAVVVVIAMLLLKREKSIEAEAPPTVEEESPTEETIEPGESPTEETIEPGESPTEETIEPGESPTEETIEPED